MTRLRWTALILITVVCLFVARSGQPARRPLVPATGLSPALRFAAVIAHPDGLWDQLNDSALVDGLFTDDAAQALGDLSASAKALELPPLEPPVRLNPEDRAKIAAAMQWLRPDQAAVVQVEKGGEVETWVGLLGGRVRLPGRLAAWFNARCVCSDAVWFRVEKRAPKTVVAAGRGAWDWPRSGAAEVQAVLPRGLPQPAPSDDSAVNERRARGQARLQTVLGAMRLPVDCARLEVAVSAAGGRLTWSARWRGTAAPQAAAGEGGRETEMPPVHLPAASAPGVFLTLQADIDWAPLYRQLVAGMTPEARADFERSMRWYRMVEAGYSDPEEDFLAVLGRGLAVVGRRGQRYNEVEWLPGVQAEVPLQPPPGGLMGLVRESPNEKFRKMMPDFAAARFDKIRLVGAPAYNVHPSYVAVTLGAEHDRYVLMRPTIAGSALMPAWQVDAQRIKFGTRPDVFDDGDLFDLQPSAPTAAAPSAEASRTVAALYLDPAAITDQLDNFRILVKVEAGADRAKPEDGLTVERIAVENERILAVTQKNMRLAAQVGWVLMRIGPVELQVTTAPAPEGLAAEIQGSVALKAR